MINLALLPLLALLAQQDLYPTPRIDEAQVVGACDFDQDGVDDLYSEREVVLSDGAFGAASVLAHPVIGHDALHVDFDADGVLDCAVATGHVWVRRWQPGLGVFLDAELVPGPFGPFVKRIAAGDLDGDGLIDLVGFDINQTVLHAYLGDGVDGLKATASSPLGIAPHRHGLADVDLDGDLDAVMTLAGGGYGVAAGAGDGTFFAPVGQSLLDLDGLALADLNADGVADLATAGGGMAHLLLGDGAGGFGPPVTTTATTGSEGVVRVAGDLDSSGTLDLAVGGYQGTTQAELTLLLGDGSGGFAGKEVFAVGATLGSFALGDFDGDGDDDLAVGSGSVWPFGVRFHERIGPAPLDVLAPVPIAIGACLAFSLGDVDLDGDDDVITFSHGDFCAALPPGFERNDGSGAFTPAPAPATVASVWGAEMVDVAGDGVLDLVYLTHDAGPALSIHPSDGLGGFLPESLEPLEAGSLYSLSGDSLARFADWTGDGIPDLCLPQGEAHLFRGEAGLGFAPPISSSAPTGGISRLTPVDLDLDGDLDLAGIAGVLDGFEVKQHVVTLIGDGAGGFASSQSFFVGTTPLFSFGMSLTAGDFDVDGLPDVFTTTTRFLPGVGGGLLALGPAIDPPAFAHTGVTTCDLDADGADDVLADNATVYRGGPDGPEEGEAYHLTTSKQARVGRIDGAGGPDLVLRQEVGLAMEEGIAFLAAKSSCAGAFDAYGFPDCPGSAGPTPKLLGGGCPTPGGVFTLELTGGTPSSIAYASFGHGPGQVALPNGCNLLLDPWLAIFAPFALDTSGAGSLPIAVSPTHPPGATSTAQVGVIDVTAPGYFTLSNGIAVTVN